MSTDIQPKISEATMPGAGRMEPVAGPSRTTGTTVWRVNVRLLIWTLVVVGIAAPSLYFWNRFQVNRQAVAILDRARSLQADEEYAKAASAAHQYLQLRPDDAEALVLRAEAFDKLVTDFAQLQRTISFHYAALKANPDRHDLRRRLAERLLLARRFDDAEVESRKVSEAVPDDVTADRVLVVSQQMQLGAAKRTAPTAVIESYRTALKRHDGDKQLSMGLAELLRKSSNELSGDERAAAIAEANAAVDQMVSVHSDDVEALLARYRYRSVYGIEGADSDLRHAREVAPDNPDVLRNSALAAAATNRTAAKGYCQKLIEVAPEERISYLTLAGLSLQWKEPKEAIVVLKAGLEKLGDNDIELNQMLLRLYLSERDMDEARATLQKFEAAVNRSGTNLATPVRRRFDEEAKVASAQLMLLEGNPTGALPILKRLVASVTESADASETLNDRVRRLQLLATAYSQLGLTDLAADAFEELTRLDPNSIEFHQLAAAAWRSSGDFDRAARQLDASVSVKSDDPVAWLGLVELRLDQQLRKPYAESRDWTGVDAALQKAQAQLGEIPPVLAIKAHVALARNERDTGLELLRRLAAMEDLAPALMLRVAILLDAADAREEADQLLAQYRKTDQDPRAATLTEAEILRRRGQTPGAIRLLEQMLEEAPEEGRDPLLRRIIGLERESGAMRSARRRLRELRKRESRELWVYENAADLALLAGDLTELHECEVELKELEGPNGTLWRYFEALRSLEGKTSGQDTDVRDATRLLAEIESLRPSWSQTPMLRGRILEMRGQLTEATEQYQVALRTGAKNMTALQWLVVALYKQNRFADAASYIRQIGQVGAFSGDLSPLAIPANLKAGRFDDAQRVARSAAELRPDDAMTQVWLGQTMALGNKGPEAEEAFRKATELAPKDARTWIGLAWFLGRERRMDEARQALEAMVAKQEIPRFDREVLLARGFDMIGDRTLAEKHYRDAIAEKPNDARIYEELGRFFFRFDQDKALAAHRKALEIDPKHDESRRAVALLMGLRGSNADWQKAIELLEDQNSSGKSNDRRLETTLLLLRGQKENTLKAVELATEMVNSEAKPNPIDRLLLAKGYEDLERLDEARVQLELVVKDNDQPTFLAPFVDFLIRYNRLDDAKRWLARLEEQEPDGARPLELRLRWLVRAGRANEIDAAVEQFVAGRMNVAKNEEQKAAVLRYAADLFTRFDRFEAAEQKLRDLMPLTPTGFESYAIWLTDRGRVDEAVALCRERTSSSDSLQGTNALIRVLTVATSRGLAPVADSAAIEELLASAQQSEKVEVQWLLELGVLRIMQKRDRDAIALYEQALAKEPKNVAVLNNLSLALVELPDRREQAMEMIDQAVATYPNSNELLDTRALVLMAVGRNQEAKELLEGLCRASRKNSRYRLHLAFALHNLKDAGESKRQIDQAIEDGLPKEILTPTEQEQLAQITADKAGPTPQ